MANELKFSAIIEDKTESTLKAIQQRIDALKDVHLKVDLQGVGDSLSPKSIEVQLKLDTIKTQLSSLETDLQKFRENNKVIIEAQIGGNTNEVINTLKTTLETAAKDIQQIVDKINAAGSLNSGAATSITSAFDASSLNPFVESLKQIETTINTMMQSFNAFKESMASMNARDLTQKLQWANEDIKFANYPDTVKAIEKYKNEIDSLTISINEEKVKISQGVQEIEAALSRLGSDSVNSKLSAQIEKIYNTADTGSDKEFLSSLAKMERDATKYMESIGEMLDKINYAEVQEGSKASAAIQKAAQEYEAAYEKLESVLSQIDSHRTNISDASKSEKKEAIASAREEIKENILTEFEEGVKGAQKLQKECDGIVTKITESAENQSSMNGKLADAKEELASCKKAIAEEKIEFEDLNKEAAKLERQLNKENKEKNIFTDIVETLRKVSTTVDELKGTLSNFDISKIFSPEKIAEFQNVLNKTLEGLLRTNTDNIGGTKGIFSNIINEANAAAPELQKKLGTGEITEQWKQAQDALRQFIADYKRLSSTSENLALATGKNTNIYSQLQSVFKLFNDAKTGAEGIAPEKLKESIQQITASISGANFEGASSQMKTLLNNIHNIMGEVERMGQGVSPLESAVRRAEAAIQNSVTGIRSAVQEMINALQNDNLTAFAKRAEAAGTAIETLAKQIGGFNQVAMNEQGVRDLLTGLGALINNLKEINGGNPIKGASQAYGQYENDIERVRKALLALLNDEEKLSAAMAVGNKNDNLTARLGTQLQAIEDFRLKLQGLLQTSFADWNFDAVKKILGSEQMALRDETSATLRYSESMRVAQDEINKLTNLINKYSETLAGLQSRGLDSMGLDTFIAKMRENIGIFQTILNSSGTGGIEAAKRSDYRDMLTQASMAGADGAKAMKDYDAALKIVQATVEKLKSAQTELDNAIAFGKSKQADVSGLENYRREILALLGTIGSSASPSDALNAIAGNPNLLRESTAEIKNLNAAIKEKDALMAKTQANQEAAEKALDKVNAKIKEMADLLNKARSIQGFNPAALQSLTDASVQMEVLARKLHRIKSGQSDESTSSVMGMPSTVRTTTEATNAINAMNQALVAKQRADIADAKNIENAKQQYFKLQVKIEETTEALKRYQALSDASKTQLAAKGVTEQSIKSIIDTYQTQQQIMSGIVNGSSNTAVDQYYSKASAATQERTKATRELSDALKELKHAETLERKNAPGTEAQNVDKARKAYDFLSREIESLQKKIAEGAKLNIDTKGVENAKTQLEALRQQMKAIMDNPSAGKVYNITQSDPYTQALNNASQQKAEITERINAAKAQGASATSKLTEEEKRLADAINQANSAGRTQSQILSDLQGLAMQYFSVYAVQQFVTELANVTGELELQKRSMEVILNSASMAQQLYGQIRSLSQESPYTFQDLLKSTRQLAAFGIETKDLYGTMKALSDIGAGLSIDVDRLILAFGHTRAYGYLSGIQNRQFENAGIDLMGELMKKYNEQAAKDEANGRVAKYVTRKDLFKRMRTRDIPFEDVQDVILGLDKPGGKFYNMQERQFDTLGGKLRNLKNNYNIMLSEMGQANMGLLKGGVGVLNTLTEDWRKYYGIIKDVIAALGAMKLAHMVMGDAAIAVNKQIAQSALTNEKNTLSTMYLNNYNRWKGGNGQLLGGYGQMFNNNAFLLGTKSNSKNNPTNLEVKGIAKSKEINNLTKQRIALTSKLTQAQREMLLVSAGVDVQQAKTISLMNGMGRGLLALRLAFLEAALSARAFMVALIANPVTWIMAAVAGITAIIGKAQEARDIAESMTSDLQSAGANDSKAINETFKEYTGMGNVIKKRKWESTKNQDGTEIFRYRLEFDDSAIRNRNPLDLLDDVTKQLQQYSPLYQGQIIDIMALNDDVEKVKKAFEYLNKTLHVERVLAFDDSIMPEVSANNRHFWNLWLTDNTLEDLKDYKNEMREIDDVIRLVAQDERAYVNLDESHRKKIETLQRDGGLSREDAMRRYAMDDRYFRVELGLKNLDRNTLNDDTEDLADSFTIAFKNKFGNDVEESAMYFQQELARIFSEAKISDEMQKLDITNMLLDKISARGKDGERFAEYFRGLKLKEHFAEQFQGVIDEDSTDEQIKAEFDKVSKATLDWAVANGIITAEAAKKHGEEYAKLFQTAAQAALNENTLQYDWQKRANKIFNVNTKLKNQIKTFVDIDDFAQAVQKNIKECQEYLARNEKHIRTLSLKLGLKIDTKLDASSLKRMIDKIAEMASKKLTEGDYEGFKALNDQAKEFQTYLDMLNSLEEAEKYNKSEGFGGSKSGSNRDKKSGGSKQDTELENLKTRGRLLRDAYEMYKKINKEKGSRAALDEVNALYGKDLKAINVDLYSIPQYRGLIEEMLEKARALAKNGDKGRLEYVKELLKLISDIDFTTFQENSEKALSSLQQKLEDLTRTWEIFNSVRDITGDKDTAMRLSGLSKYTNAPTPDKSQLLQKITSDTLSEIGLIGVAIEWDKVFSMGESELESYVQDLAYGSQAAQKNIKSIIKALQDWKKAQGDLTKEDILTYAKAMGAMMDITSQKKRIEADKQNKLAAIQREEDRGNAEGGVNRGGKLGITREEADKARSIVKAQALEKEEKLSVNYLTMFSHAVSSTTDEISKSAKYLRSNLEERLKAGPVSPEQYSELAAKIDKAERDALSKTFFGSKTGLTSFMKGGLPGLQEYYDDELAKEREKKARGENFDVKKAEERANKIARITRLLGNLSTVTEMVTGALDGLQQATESLSQMFDALGNEGMANTFSDISDTVGAISSIFSPANNILSNAMSGNVSGVIGSAISAPVQMIASPITAFSQLHDKKIERNIEEMRRQFTKQNNTVTTIKNSRERQLGYDNGSVIRMYQQLYKNASTISEKAMQEYYNRAGTSTTASGYQQEYNTLIAERENLMKQYNAEDSKKKSDSGKMEEYLTQIAELDDQIQYYAEDMYKSLYSIDFESWSDQVSDALSSAWENGTDAVEAYDDAVRGIMQDVVKNAIKLAVVATAIEQLREAISKAYDVNNPASSMQEIYKLIAEAMGTNGYVTQALKTYTEGWNELETKLAEAGIQLRDLEEIANNLFSVDLSSWEDQLSSALTDAFYNGENAAQKYADTVKSVMQEVVNSMLKTLYIEPMIQQLKQQLYGYTDEQGTYHQGAFNAQDPAGSVADVINVLKNYFGENGNGKAMLTASNEFATGIQQLLKESGLSLLNTTSSSTTNSIQNQATEETMGIVSGYLAAIRQDVSVQRVFITQLVQEYMPDMKDKWTSTNTSLSNIDRNTANIYKAISEGDGALYNAIRDIRNDIHSSAQGTGSLKVR